MRFMMMVDADREHEAGQPSPGLKASSLTEELTKAELH
jgi:hypothetical protein